MLLAAAALSSSSDLVMAPILSGPGPRPAPYARSTVSTRRLRNLRCSRNSFSGCLLQPFAACRRPTAGPPSGVNRHKTARIPAVAGILRGPGPDMRAPVNMVGLRGFEPPTFGPPDRRANQAAPQPVSQRWYRTGTWLPPGPSRSQHGCSLNSPDRF